MTEPSHWSETDKKRFEYRLAVADHHARLAQAYLQTQVDYGKWLLASLLVVNSGALLGVFNSTRADAYLGTGAHWWFFAGAALAVFAGFAAWINWGFNFSAADLVRDAWLYDTPSDFKTRHKRYERVIQWTYWIVIVLGFTSAGCSFRAVWVLQNAIRPLTP